VIDRHMQEMVQSMVSSPQSFKRGPASRLGISHNRGFVKSFCLSEITSPTLRMVSREDVNW
jgi:hypothetical protein